MRLNAPQLQALKLREWLCQPWLPPSQAWLKAAGGLPVPRVFPQLLVAPRTSYLWESEGRETEGHDFLSPQRQRPPGGMAA